MDLLSETAVSIFYVTNEKRLKSGGQELSVGKNICWIQWMSHAWFQTRTCKKCIDFILGTIWSLTQSFSHRLSLPSLLWSIFHRWSWTVYAFNFNGNYVFLVDRLLFHLISWRLSAFPNTTARCSDKILDFCKLCVDKNHKWVLM